LWIPRRHPILSAFAGYLGLSAAATWPLVARFGTEIGGDLGDAWQTTWGFWWWREALFKLGTAPTFCPDLRHPQGIPMWFQTWDLPAALGTLPLWGIVPEVSVYNVAIFMSYPLAGLTMFLLAKELWGGGPDDEGRLPLGPFLAGALYTISTYHFGHALGHLHIVSMEWSPLYFLGLVRTVKRPVPAKGGWKAPVLGGVGLALAATASFYHLMFCFVGTLVLFACWLWPERALFKSVAFWKRAGILVGTFLLLTGWLYGGMLRAHLSEPYSGAHDPVWFSADLQAFFLPNAASAWAGSFEAWRHWTGNNAETAAYLGWVSLGLALFAALKLKATRPFFAVAVAGFLLALGPHLHVGGRIHADHLMPYGWIEQTLPILKFTGVPTRFSWLATFGIAVAAGATLTALARRGRNGAIAAVVLGALGLAEQWPHSFATSSWPTPPLIREWAKDPERWAVLDATDAQRALWHQVLHHHPQVGGYITRAPQRLETWLTTTPTLSAFFGPRPAVRLVDALTRVDQTIDFDWGYGSPAPEVPADRFQVEWEGTLEIADAGEYRLFLACDDGAQLFLDGTLAVDNGGEHAAQEREGKVTLARGRHALSLRYLEANGGALVKLHWQPPGGTRAPVPAEHLRTPDGKPGLLGHYKIIAADLGEPRNAAVKRLQDMKVRFVLVDGDRAPAAAALVLPKIYEGEGVAIYEVPAARKD
jgi:hypothetical protein